MINRTEINSLEVVGDIGAINASQYLSMMMKKKFRVSIPWVALYPFERIPRLLGEPDEVMTCVHLNMSGDLKGAVLFIFPKKSALAVADLLQGKKIGTTRSLDEMSKSALKESGNILVNAYLNSIAEKLNLKIFDSVPNIATDMLDAVMDGILAGQASKARDCLVLKNDYILENKKVEAHALILFDPDSYKKLRGRLRRCEIKLT